VVAVTLQGSDQGDTVTLDATLSEAGMAVAELVEREAEQRPEDTPKVNVEGIEEMVADKGYRLRQEMQLEVTEAGPRRRDCSILGDPSSS
jgi:hypothetical protein